MRPPARPPGPGTLIAGALALVAAVSFALGPVVEAATHLTFGFPAYYTSSRLVIEGRWAPDVYDNDWFHAESAALTGGVEEIYRPNTPMASLIAIPLAGLDLMTARRTWLVLQVVGIAGLLALLLAALPALRSPPFALGLAALVLAWSPLHEDVRLGQAYVFIALLQALVVLGTARSGATTTGLALGVSIAAKVASVPVALVLAVRGGFRALAWAAGAVLLAGIATLPFAGLDGWTRFVQVFVDDVVHPGGFLALPAYQSTTGLLAHLFVPNGRWNPAPAMDAPWLAAALGLGLTVAVLVMTVWTARRGPAVPAVGAALASGLLVLNLAQEYHGAMLLPPAAVAIATWRSGTSWRGRTAWLGLALLLAGGPFFYRDAALPGGWPDILWYPRLVGAWLLWGWLLMAMTRARDLPGQERDPEPERQRETAETRYRCPSRSAA